jgi:hypothetical protein
MKAKNILQMAIIAALAACGEGNSSKKNEAANSQLTVTENKTQVLDQSPVPYYSANGNEPGFRITIDMAMNGNLLVTLVNNYGADTLQGTFNKAPLYIGKKPNMETNEVKLEGTFEGSNGGEACVISIFAEPCTDDSGKEMMSSVTIKFGKTELKGCGGYID